ncbi:MAG: polyprenyl synthetase family protein [Flavobacteriales bacterium]|jgi:geranylgeranyl diphosphate synthase type II|nr:polyprenyl synthetase family protein [Flavobacteriales bacterium]MBK7270556.1 polyprenyl synthetase family protein [Flavobacteriales bacterium]MBK9540014.1 polyprenyl synthetase family protein [Flavobacteriales bacterium]
MAARTTTSADVLRVRFEKHAEVWIAALPSLALYAPMAYLMRLPAKRVRPVAVLMGCELFGGEVESALDEALGIELFHNFTLMHDDIMDHAPLRRGQPTVHAKWDVNTAILSGDAMLVKAYQLMGRHPKVLALFSEHALGVCEGQQLDMEFETRHDVGADEYLEMIRLKTAVLLRCAVQTGALVAGASEEQAARLGTFGEELGLAFQLRDDILDAFGDPKKVGKQQGGDLRAGKKTWILIRALELSSAAGRSELREELARSSSERDVPRMLGVLHELDLPALAAGELDRHHQKAMAALEAVVAPDDGKEALRALAASLLQRAS